MKIITKKSEWDIILNNFRIYDIYFTYEYYKLYADYYGGKVEAVYWEDENIKIFWPHIVRDISKEFKNFKYYDLTTPYGYGGPLVLLKRNSKNIDNKKSISKFFETYKNYALENKYICEFIRFYPFLENWKFFKEIFNIEFINHIVVIDLKRDIEDIWRNMRKGYRYEIRKTLGNNVSVKVIENPTSDDIENFIKLYYYTMDINRASKKYYFSYDFIKKHFDMLNAILINAEHNGKVIGSSIFIFDKKGKIIHYYLSGSLRIKGIYPAKVILFKAICWAKRNNFELLNLGGGRGCDDALFKFKSGFSKQYLMFHIGKIIFNKEMYDLLTKKAKVNENTNYFPLYRLKTNKV